MTLEEIQTLKRQQKRAWDVWHDNLSEAPRWQLIATLERYMSLADAESLLSLIQEGINQSIKEEITR